MYTPRIITDSVREPISVSEFNAHAKIDIDDEDALVESIYIPAARRYVEARASITIHQKTLELALAAWPGCDRIVLPRATPLISIASLKYTDSAGVERTWAAGNYIADTDPIPGALVCGYSISWPSATLSPASPIKVRYLAGIPTEDEGDPPVEAPGDLKLLVSQVAGHFFKNRESVVINDRGVSVRSEVIAQTVDALIANWIQYSF